MRRVLCALAIVVGCKQSSPSQGSGAPAAPPGTPPATATPVATLPSGSGSAAPPTPGPSTDGPASDAVAAAPAGRRVVELTSEEHARVCALLSDGKIRCWGNHDAVPVEQPTVPNIKHFEMFAALDGDGVVWRRQWWDGVFSKTELANIKLMDASPTTIVGLTSDGTLVMLDVQGKRTDIKGWPEATELAVGEKQSCVRLTTGVSCWTHSTPKPSAAFSGKQLIDRGRGVGFSTDSKCVLEPSGAVKCFFDWVGFKPSEEPDVRGARFIAGGDTRLCGVFDKEVVCVRKQPFSDEKVVERTPIDDVTALAVTSEHACALRGDGNVMCWGTNHLGQLGDGTLVDRAKPEPVKGLLDDTLPPATTGAGTESNGEPMSWDALPKSCGHDTVPIGKPLTVHTAYATEGSEFHIYLADYAIDRELLKQTAGVRPRGNQRVLIIDLYGDHAGTPGTYQRGGGKRYANPRLYGTAGAEDDGVDGVAVKIAQRSAGWVCGTITAGTAKPVAFAARILD